MPRLFKSLRILEAYAPRRARLAAQTGADRQEFKYNRCQNTGLAEHNFSLDPGSPLSFDLCPAARNTAAPWAPHTLTNRLAPRPQARPATRPLPLAVAPRVSMQRLTTERMAREEGLSR